MGTAAFQEEVLKLRGEVKVGNLTNIANMMEEIAEGYANYKEHEKEEEFAKFVKLCNMGATDMMFTITWATMIFGNDKAPKVFQSSFPFNDREQFYKSRFAGKLNDDPEFTAHMEAVLIGDKNTLLGR